MSRETKTPYLETPRIFRASRKSIVDFHFTLWVRSLHTYRGASPWVGEGHPLHPLHPQSMGDWVVDLR